MLAIRLPAEIETRLDALAAATGRTKTFYAREAILEHLDDLEDLYLAEQRLIEVRAGRSPTHNEQRKKNLEELFRLIRELPFTEDFIPARSDEVRPNPFEDWEASDLAEPAKPAKTSKMPKRVRKAAA